mgnify:CR=1 FL=1
MAEINIIKLIKDGDQSVNIDIRDGDTIIVGKSDTLIREQIISINKSNLTPNKINVFINGNVGSPGQIMIPKGFGLYEAILSAGGELSNTGNVEFIRFNEEGGIKKEKLKISPNAKKGSKANPFLFDGDIIIVRKNIIGKSTAFLSEITAPIVSSIGLYNIFFE